MNGVRLPFWLVGYVIFSFIVAVAAIAVAIHTLEVTGPVFLYDREIYQPDQSELCPGDLLIFDYEVSIVAEGQILIRFVETFTRSDGHHVAFADHQHYVLQDGPATYKRTASIPIPDLPPGDYEYRRGGGSEFSRPAYLRVPFTIPDSCAE